MAKQKNPNIGFIKCLEGCDHVAAVRKDQGGKLYTDCPHCGKLPAGNKPRQERIMAGATVWGEQGQPPGSCPRWIAENWPRSKMYHIHHREAAFLPIGGSENKNGSENLTSTEKPQAKPQATRKPAQGITPPPAPPAPKETPQASPVVEPEPAEAVGFDFME